MVKFNEVDYLDDQQWSPLWEAYLQQAKPFDPMIVHEIAVIAQLPNQTGVLIFTEEVIYHSEESGLAVLQRISNAQCFPHYRHVRSVLKALRGFGSYKSPWLCPFFALFPLEDTRHTTWINPLKIERLHYKSGRHYAEMTFGTNLALPILRRSIITRAEITSYGLSLIRRDVFRFGNKTDTPLSYLDLPDTPFARLLATRPILAQYNHRIGDFTRYYNEVLFLYRYERLEDDPREIDLE